MVAGSITGTVLVLVVVCDTKSATKTLLDFFLIFSWSRNNHERVLFFSNLWPLCVQLLELTRHQLMNRIESIDQTGTQTATTNKKQHTRSPLSEADQKNKNRLIPVVVVVIHLAGHLLVTMSMAIYHSIMRVVAPVYQRVVATELNKMGEYCRR
jgi:hypothetical protein